jgi:hypothetical protein
VPNEIIDLLVGEVSLVDEPANERPFLLIKNRRGESAVADNQLVELALGTELENEDAIDKKIAELPSDSQEALKGAFRILQAHSENITSDVLKSLAPEMGVEFTAPAPTGDKDGEDDKGDKPLDTKGLAPEVATVLEALQKSNSTLEERLLKSDAKVDDLKRSRRKDIMIAKVRDLRIAKAEPNKLADILLQVEDVSPESADQLREILEATSKVVEESDLLKAIGSDTQGGTDETAWDKLSKAARKMSTESGGEITFATAQDIILKNDRKLAEQYSKENR